MNEDITRAWLAAIVESSDDAIVSKDLTGTITSWNRGAERLFGYTAAEAIGKSVTMLIPEERHNEEPDILGRVCRGDRVEHYETVRQRKDGRPVHISLSVSPIRDGKGRIIGASKIARDITERREAAAALLEAAQRAREQAEDANRSKDEFLAMLGHELRNPLSAVRNAIAAAMLDDRLRGRALEIARRQAEQLGRIVDDLLDVARVTRGYVPLRKAKVSLQDVVQRATDATRGLLEERGHSVTMSAPADPIALDADAARLEQAFTNLLTNAAKYTDPGGMIDITVRRDGAAALVILRDNGVGIAPDLLPKIFDLFAQGDRSLERAQGGLGIGLTLVRRIVELHGGEITAASAGIGRGAEFVVRLPALPAGLPSAAAAPPACKAAHGGGPARVLMVEDNADAAESLLLNLEFGGHQVRAVRDGFVALDAARAQIPDVVLVDIGLPGMSGYDVARAMRRDPILKHLTLVALTGYGCPEDKNQAMAAGFDYHLVKPVDLDTLESLLRRCASPQTQ